MINESEEDGVENETGVGGNGGEEYVDNVSGVGFVACREGSGLPDSSVACVEEEEGEGR